MSGIQHTPGPWFQSHRAGPDNRHRTQVYDADGETIATLHWYPVALDGEIATARDANARLIAAAPDMLAALKLARIFIERSRLAYGATAILDVLNPTIAKAEGAAQ